MKRILVGLDNSARSGSVLDSAVELANLTGSTLVLFRAFTIPVGLPSGALAHLPTELPSLLESDARRSLEELARRVPADKLGKIRVALGTAWQQICQVAKDEKVDLIIIGSHGYSAIDRLLGTTAARVINHADRSVLVVRPKEGEHAFVPPGP